MVYRNNALNATAVNIRNGRCYIKSISVGQKATAAPELYLQLFNVAAPTVGTTAPNMVIPVPAGSSNVEIMIDKLTFQGKFGGRHFSTALSVACTTTHDGLTAPTAGQEPIVEIHYENLG